MLAGRLLGNRVQRANLALPFAVLLPLNFAPVKPTLSLTLYRRSLTALPSKFEHSITLGALHMPIDSCGDCIYLLSQLHSNPLKSLLPDFSLS